MSGHSKWATTKHQKAAKDKVRGKLFAKLIRQVEVAAREGGGDIESNATLRRGDEPESITPERAFELLAEKRAKGPTTRKRAAKKTTKKAAKTTAKKTTAKKSTAKKSAAAKSAD